MKKYISPFSLFFGVLTLAASLFVGYYVVPHKVKEKVVQQSKIVRGNTRFQNWETIPVPLFQKIFLFNVTNPQDVILGEKPVLQEIGPYVYQQKRKKFDINFNEENDTIFYKERTDYYFRPDLSNGLESDFLTFINLPYVSAAHKAASMNSLSRYVITDILSGYRDLQLYVNTTVRELLFSGMYLPYMKDLSELQGKVILPNNTFGLYYGKNGSDAGRFEIYSGVKHPEKFGNVVTWNGISQLDWWDDQYCNQINGSDGAVFRPFSTKERVISLFIPGLCKSFRFKFDSDGLDVKGIPVLKYSIPHSFFESGKSNPENRCYCITPGENGETCPEDGVFEMAGCGKGVMMLSQPHFYQGSQTYINQSVGLQPDKERHEMAIYIEPYTSVSAKINLRFQMNADLRPNKFFRALKKIPRMVHPLFWIDQSVEIPDNAAVILREKLYGVVNLANLLTHVGIIIGSALIILSFLCFFLCSSNANKREEADKIECVSYHPQGTLPKDKIAYATVNGKIHNRQTTSFIQNPPPAVEISPLLKRNGVLSSGDNALRANQEEAPLHPSSQDTNVNGNSDNHQGSVFENGNSQQQQIVQSRSSDPIKQPDSRLSPFPSVTDYSSSLSIAAHNNTLKELVDATSSYENL